MSSQEIHIIAILTPKEGKLERLNELMKDMCKTVHSKEDYTLRYLQTEQVDAKEGKPKDVIIFETYKNQAAADNHTSEPHFKELFAVMGKEDLLVKPPYVAHSKSIAGFDLDHQLL